MQSFLFPKKCACCGSYIYKRTNSVVDLDVRLKSLADMYPGFCNSCLEQIIKMDTRVRPPYCKFCGRGAEYCGCGRFAHAYDEAVAPFYYDGAIRNAILRLKYGSHEGVAVDLGGALGDEVSTRLFGVCFDIVTCVPSTPRSIALRGFNQSRSIAENLGLERHGISNFITDCNLLCKSDETATQHRLGAYARRKNLESAIRLRRNRDVTGKTILLVDDIVTTGATGDACACILKLNGAKAVYFATAAMAKF